MPWALSPLKTISLMENLRAKTRILARKCSGNNHQECILTLVPQRSRGDHHFNQTVAASLISIY